MITRSLRSAALWTCLVWIPARVLMGGDAWPDAFCFAAGWTLGGILFDVWNLTRKRADQ